MLKKSIWLIIILSVIIISTFVSVKVKSSFIPQPNLSQIKESDAAVQYLWNPEDDYNIAYLTPDNADKLEEKAELVLRVIPIDDGKDAAYSLIRKCNVVSSLKGNIDTNTIYIYEPSHLRGNYYWCSQGYMAMEKDKEYIVFLKKIVNSEYADSEEICNGYVFACPYVSKYTPGQEASLVKFEEETGEQVFYDQVCSQPMLFDDERSVKVYNDLLKDVERKYNLK